MVAGDSVVLRKRSSLGASSCGATDTVGIAVIGVADLPGHVHQLRRRTAVLRQMFYYSSTLSIVYSYRYFNYPAGTRVLYLIACDLVSVGSKARREKELPRWASQLDFSPRALARGRFDCRLARLPPEAPGFLASSRLQCVEHVYRLQYTVIVQLWHVPTR